MQINIWALRKPLHRVYFESGTKHTNHVFQDRWDVWVHTTRIFSHSVLCPFFLLEHLFLLCFRWKTYPSQHQGLWYNIARCTVVFAMSKSFIIEAILFTDNLISSVELIKSISHLKDSKADTYVSSVSPSSKESVLPKNGSRHDNLAFKVVPWNKFDIQRFDGYTCTIFGMFAQYRIQTFKGPVKCVILISRSFIIILRRGRVV